MAKKDINVGDKYVGVVPWAGYDWSYQEGEEFYVTEKNIETIESLRNAGYIKKVAEKEANSAEVGAGVTPKDKKKKDTSPPPEPPPTPVALVQ